MRIVGGTEIGMRAWWIWDVELCRRTDYVLWIDDETAQYEQLAHPFVIVGDRPATNIHQARRIAIYLDQLLILINPIDDEIDAGEKTVQVIGRTADMAQ